MQLVALGIKKSDSRGIEMKDVRDLSDDLLEYGIQDQGFGGTAVTE